MNNVKNVSIYNKELIIMIMGTELVITDALLPYWGKLLN